ncbi:acyl-CoA dehydrogenase family protein [Streptomyces sp. A3M-1-3]|uniref:acyl-CoA dehydrogenase family protein n=1 Tax=Streptomyces sp. A3M-1-3 TaxID=2962044 RepID=UPI0020B78558|nr:acyl-CoA dehydrogenase family protein [Streptomyces sp. A3M-1-3]MCP3820891.1 acyl-CoA dehydrogenase family protein [Streptomyces sp. A3M-1-3]
MVRGLPECPPQAVKLRDRVTDFVRRRVMPSEATLDAGGPAAAATMRDLQSQARDQGLWALPLPAELGGQGVPLSTYAHIAEAEGASDHGPAALGSATLLDVLMLRRHGSDRVRRLYPERLAAGELRTCYAMTEPDTPGTDPFLTETRAAQRTDGSWTVSGRKWFTSGAGEADLVTVLARTAGAPPDREGLSLLLVPTDTPGFRVVRELPVLGAGGQWEIELDRVTVPADHLLGERGKALAIAGERLQLGRTLRCLRWLGQGRRAFDLMGERANTRTRSYGPLADHQLVQRHVFEALLALRTTRPLVYEAVARINAGQDAQVEVGLAKVAAARMLQQVADAAIQIYGAAGLGPDTPLPALFRTGRTARILDGPDELHMTSVARRVLRERGRQTADRRCS